MNGCCVFVGRSINVCYKTLNPFFDLLFSKERFFAIVWNVLL